MTRTLEYGWFLPTVGDAPTRLNDPKFAIPADQTLFERVTIAADKAGFDYMLVPTASFCWEAWICAAVLTAKSNRISSFLKQLL